ncbi:stalk domain-containing protein [Paenibacillus sp. LHD-117]|uniref:stalk domain-containing protein n=1 Tax=Paenibacillus sp. LHD-117 TaxID=3071412 RepID=UPI0027E14E7F|nr:stalk domain-containing protein [Paenibacillus sp. LHD-117]MDQ6423644.1 stalk domain-containing protein [Paenibacillus sp. LHD-117]
MKKIWAVLIVTLISGMVSIHAWANNGYQKIGIEVDGKSLGVEAYLVDGRTMVPMRAIFEKLQSKVSWDEKTRTVTAVKDATTVKLTIDAATAHVNAQAVTLDVPPMLLQGKTYVPLRFVSEALGAEVGYDAKRKVASVNTMAGAGGHDHHSEQPLAAEPFVVKGYVTDRQGTPMEGVEIIADNQLARDSYQTAYTDENGYYQIDLPELNTTWNMISYYEHEFEGKVHAFNLTSATDRPFGANKGAVRDFVWEDIHGRVVIDIYDYPDNENWPEFSLDDVELTLTPLTPLIDGSKGEVITGMSVFHPDGAGLQSVPIAKYEITARWVPDGMEPIPLLVAEYSSDKYTESVITADFEDIYGTTKRVAIRVAFP